jgi:hypothetical protein
MLRLPQRIVKCRIIRAVYLASHFMSLHQLQPAAGIVARFGGCRPMSRVLGVYPSTISRWMTSVELGGTGGFIPRRHWRKILDIGRAQGLRLKVSDLAGHFE